MTPLPPPRLERLRGAAAARQVGALEPPAREESPMRGRGDTQEEKPEQQALQVRPVWLRAAEPERRVARQGQVQAREPQEPVGRMQGRGKSG